MIRIASCNVTITSIYLTGDAKENPDGAGCTQSSGLESKAQKGSEGSVPPMQCGMARSWLIEEGARLEIMWRTLMLNINKRTKSSIEWLVYKPGLRRNSGEDLASWWTTSWRVHNVGKKTDLPFLLPSYVIPYLWFHPSFRRPWFRETQFIHNEHLTPFFPCSWSWARFHL